MLRIIYNHLKTRRVVYIIIFVTFIIFIFTIFTLMGKILEELDTQSLQHIDDIDSAGEDNMSTESEYESDIDDENNDIIRAKWQIDGSKTLDECVQKLENFIAYIKALKLDGWELRKVVDDDYGFIRRAPPTERANVLQ